MAAEVDKLLIDKVLAVKSLGGATHAERKKSPARP